MTMSSKLRVIVAVALMFGSASTVLAASNGRAAHRHPRIERVAPPTLLEGRDLGVQQWPGRPLCDDGGFRIRPCDVGGN
jgi:hypothetical protein